MTKRLGIELKWTITPLDDQASALPASPTAAAAAARKEAVQPVFPNAYNGFHPPADGYQVKRIPTDSLTPEQFHAQFIATRTPVVLTGQCK